MILLVSSSVSESRRNFEFIDVTLACENKINPSSWKPHFHRHGDVVVAVGVDITCPIKIANIPAPLSQPKASQASTTARPQTFLENAKLFLILNFSL